MAQKTKEDLLEEYNEIKYRYRNFWFELGLNHPDTKREYERMKKFEAEHPEVLEK